MDISIVIKLLELFILLFLGYFLVAGKVLPKESSKIFSSLIFYVTLPALILNTMAGGTDVPKEDILTVLLVTATYYTTLIGVSFIVPKVLRVDKNYHGLYRFMTVFGNVAFVGYPVVSAVLGPRAVFYAVLFNLPFSLLVYSLGIGFISMDTDHDVKVSFKHMLNPAMIATLCGLVLFFMKIELPSLADNLTESVGKMTTPLSLFVIGGSLYGVKIKSVLKKYHVFIFCLMKLFVLPTLVAVVVRIIGLQGYMAYVPIVMSAMPMAANTVIISQKYNGHVLEASEAVFISTIMMIVSLPYVLFMADLVVGGFA
jgi:predicted permease